MHPKVHSKLRILCYFSKIWLKIWRKRWWSSLFWWNRSILQIFLFFACYIFCYWRKLPSHTCLWSPTFIFFPETLQIIRICEKVLLGSFFSVISSQNLKIQMKIASHAWLEIIPWLTETKGFFCVCCYFCIKCCSARRLTTIDFKGLLYLMWFLFLFCFN